MLLLHLDRFVVSCSWLTWLNVACHCTRTCHISNSPSFWFLSCKSRLWPLFHLIVQHIANIARNRVLCLNWISKLLISLCEILLCCRCRLCGRNMINLWVQFRNTSLVFNLYVYRIILLSNLALRINVVLSASIHGVVHYASFIYSSSVVHKWIALTRCLHLVSTTIIKLRVSFHISILLSITCLWNNTISNYAKCTWVLALSIILEIIRWLLNSVELIIICLHWATVVNWRIIDCHMHHWITCILNLGAVLFHCSIIWNICILAQSWTKLALCLILRLNASFFEIPLIIHVQCLYLSAIWLLSVLDILLLLAH